MLNGSPDPDQAHSGDILLCKDKYLIVYQFIKIEDSSFIHSGDMKEDQKRTK